MVQATTFSRKKVTTMLKQINIERKRDRDREAEKKKKKRIQTAVEIKHLLGELRRCTPGTDPAESFLKFRLNALQ